MKIRKPEWEDFNSRIDWWSQVDDYTEAMTEYSKLIALEFSEWNCKNLWSTYNEMWYPYRNEDNPITGTELFNLFLKEKNEDK